uniref:Polyprotein n=1 Tax=Orthopteran flavi-related virus TaxID=2822566 RepID=A0A8A6RHQ0_9FLAV|nr:polyprotein [Orthopteran flavi-related virus]
MTNSEIRYSRTLLFQDITTSSQQQRKGRTGRTNRGVYYSPVGKTIVGGDFQNIYIAPEVMLRLHRMKFNFALLSKYSQKFLADLYTNYLWLLPEPLSTSPCAKQINDVLREAGKRDVSMAYETKLKYVSNVEGDMVFNYLRMWYTQDEIDKVLTGELKRCTSTSDTQNFYKCMQDYWVLINSSTEELVGKLKHILSLTSFSEDALLNPAGHEDAYDWLTTRSAKVIHEPEPEGEENSVGNVLGFAISQLALVAGGCTVAHLSFDRASSRVFTKVVKIHKADVAANAKNYALKYSELKKSQGKPHSDTYSRSIHEWKKTFEHIWQRIIMRIKKFWPFAGKSEFKQHSADQIINALDAAKNVCFNFFTKMMASNSVLALVDLRAAFGGSLLGLIYTNMERYLTKTISFVMLAIAAGLLHYFTNTVALTAAAVGAIVTYFLKSWIMDLNTPEHIKRLSPQDNAPFVRMLGSTLVGAGVSLGLKMLSDCAPAAAVPLSNITANLTPVTSVVNGGQAGLSVIVIKNLYHLIVKSNDIGESFVLAASTLTSLFRMNWLGCVVTGVTLAGLLGLRGMYFHMRKEYARDAKGPAALEEWREAENKFDEIAMWALSVTSVIANPSSFIGILVAGLCKMSEPGQTAKKAFIDAFQRYAGVNFFLVLVEKAVQYVRNADTAENSGCDILGMVASLVSMLSSTVYLTQVSKVGEFAANSTGWLVAGFNKLREWMTFAFDVLLKAIKKVIKTIGNWIGVGVKEAFIGKTDKEIGSKSQEEIIPLVYFDESVARAFMQLYNESKGLSLWESAFFFSMVPGSVKTWGNINDFKLFQKIMSSHNNKASSIIEFKVNLDMKVFCVPTNQIAAKVQQMMGVGHYENNTLTVVHKKTMDVKIEYSNVFSETRVHHMLVITTAKQHVAVSIYGVQRDESTQFYLTGFGISEQNMAELVTTMLKFCCTFKNASRTVCKEVPELLKSELGIKDLHLGFGDMVKNKLFENVLKINKKLTPETFKKAWECLLIDRPEVIDKDYFEYWCVEISRNYYNSTLLTTLEDKNFFHRSDESIPAGLPNEFYKLPNDCDTYDWIDLGMQIDNLCHDVEISNSENVGRHINFGRGIDDIKEEMLVVSYHVGVGMFLETPNGLSCSPYGLDCHCAFKYNMVTNQLFYKYCEEHQSPLKATAKVVPRFAKAGKIPLLEDLKAPFLRAINEMILNAAKQGVITTVVDKSKQFGLQEVLKGAGSWVNRNIFTTPEPDDVKENSSNLLNDILQFWQRTHVKDGLDEKDLFDRGIDRLGQGIVAGTADFTVLDPPEEEEFREEKQIIKELNVDYPSSLLGFSKPVISKGIGWDWHKDISVPYVNPEDNMQLYKNLNKRGVAISKPLWDRMAHNERYLLPKRVTEVENVVHMHASRAFFKAQLLHEADPEFFDDATVILDPACGYGGFEQYFGTVYYDRPKYIFVNSLNIAQHRIPDIGRMQVKGSNVHVVSLFNTESPDRNNIKFESCRNRIKKSIEQAVGPRAVDLIMLDIGEFRDNSNKQLAYWQQEGANCDSLIGGIEKLLTNLRDGGKLLMKFTGHFSGGQIVLSRVLSHFTRFKAHKLATQGYFSTEFYIYASGYHTNTVINNAKVGNFYNWIGRHIYEGLKRAEHYIIRPHDYTPKERYDWVYPKHSQMVYCTVPYEDYPPGYKYKVNGKYWKIDDTWQPNWNPRLNEFFKYIHRCKKLRFVKVAKKKAEHLKMLGHFRVTEKQARIKDTYNALISDCCYNTFGIDAATSTYGHTQSATQYSEMSFKKRLDVSPGELNPMVMQELADILPLMVSEYGRTLQHNCKMLTKDEVLPMLNKQGATGIFSQFNNLKDFITKVPDWYEICMEHCVNKWARGEGTHGHFSIMHKNEPKARKDATDGKLNYASGEVTRQELIENSRLPHRYIQYADEITRISHYIVLGDLINKAGINKVYKGTINGTPPFTQGNILRSCWDLNTEQSKRVFDFGDNPHGGLFIEDVNGHFSKEQGMAAGVCLDFSGWDGTVTAAERYLEYKFIADFYPPELSNIIKNMLSEMCFGICLNHDGDVWVRSGQRGSGEIITSFGNTLLVGANVYRAVSKILAIPIEEVLRTVAKVHYMVGNKIKTLEVTQIPQFSDGDDTVIISSSIVCKNIQDHLAEIVAEANKLIRSGQGAGSKLVNRFHDLEFCSHTYEPIVIGDYANQLSCNQEKQILMAKAGMFKLRYLPCKPITDILSRFRLTLKYSTQQWKDDDGEIGGCVDITRSKILSYLLLYPHYRLVRYTCIGLLSVIGDGPSSMGEFFRRYKEELAHVDFATSMGALNSVYGVSTLNGIGLRQYPVENKGHKLIRHNALLVGYNVPSDVTGLTRSLCRWTLTNKIKDYTPLFFDHKFLKQFGFAYCNLYGRADVLVKSMQKIGPIPYDFDTVWRNYVQYMRRSVY